MSVGAASVTVMAPDPSPPSAAPPGSRAAASRDWAGRTRVLRWICALAVVVLAIVALAAGWADVCSDNGSSCRPVRAGDGLTIAVALLLVLLAAPDVVEASVAGLFSVRTRLDEQEERLAALDAQLAAVASASAVGGGAVVQVLSGVATGAYAAGGVEPAAARAAVSRSGGTVDLARFLAAELLIGGLGDLGAGLLAGANLRLYLPEDGGRLLLPVLHQPSTHADADVWRAGEGAVGRAWSTGAPIALRGAAVQDDVRDLPPERRRRYAGLQEVVAVPVVNAAGRPIGVLSASSQAADADLADGDTRDELIAAAEVLARLLVDLLAWADDRPAPLSTAALSTAAAHGAGAAGFAAGIPTPTAAPAERRAPTPTPSRTEGAS